MQIQLLRVTRWRHFREVEIKVPQGAPVVCLVGPNGSGKSQLLELVAACSHELGLAAGNESLRGNPFSEQADFEIHMSLSSRAVPALASPDAYPDHLRSLLPAWDTTVTLRYTDGARKLTAGGVPPEQASTFAQQIVGLIRNSAEVHYMFLDADRAYPKMLFQNHDYGPAMERDWRATQKDSAFRPTRNLYEEWFKFLVGEETQKNNLYAEETRRARAAGRPDPTYKDYLQTYRESVTKVLPHLTFVGVESRTRQINFDSSTGLPLSFSQLSGGEREIAFLIGQIERFSLRKGLLLVDEPELHLNYDLLRNWISFLVSTVQDGQVWLATHSLEVVEVTGQDATFLLQHDASTRKVREAVPLSSQPVVTALSRAVGSPAFSITGLAFVFVEGEEEIGERERFRLMCNTPLHVRVIESKSCKQVVSRLAELRQIATAANQPIRAGAVVDGDWRSPSEVQALKDDGVFVLPVHEIENFLLHPPTLSKLLTELGRPTNAVQLIVDAADRRAGAWIFDAARTAKDFSELSAPNEQTRILVHGLTWQDFNKEGTVKAIAESEKALEPAQKELLQRHLNLRSKTYARHRESGAIWKHCHGKEIFRSLVGTLGFSGSDTAERAICNLWQRDPSQLPQELLDLRNYFISL